MHGVQLETVVADSSVSKAGTSVLHVLILGNWLVVLTFDLRRRC
jgi:hypothetical protein